MLKTKFRVQLHKNGNHSQNLLKIVGNHNAGKKAVTLLDIIGFINCYAALYPDVIDGRQLVTWEGENTLHLSENSEPDAYLTISEYEVVEMQQEKEELQPEILN